MYGNLFNLLAIKFQINYTAARALSLKNSLKLNNRFESLSVRKCNWLKLEKLGSSHSINHNYFIYSQAYPKNLSESILLSLFPQRAECQSSGLKQYFELFTWSFSFKEWSYKSFADSIIRHHATCSFEGWEWMSGMFYTHTRITSAKTKGPSFWISLLSLARYHLIVLL